MAGLVAVARRGARAPAVAPEELDALCADYRSLRGGSELDTAGGEAARAAVIAAPGALTAALEREHGSWTAYVGRPLRNDQSDPTTWDGQFAAVGHDSQTDAFSVISDPLGMQAVYVAETAERLFVSTSVLALAKHLRLAPNPVAIDTFLRMGTQFGSQTYWDGANRLEPATVIRCGAGGCEREIYWRAQVEPELDEASMAEAVDRCLERAAGAIGRYLVLGARQSCDITGGWDSRLLALLLRHAGLSFATNTVGPDEALDVRLGQQVAGAGGWRWWREELPADWVAKAPDRLGHALAWGDGQLEVTQLATVLWHHEQRSREVDVQFSGGGGEHWRYYGWMQEFPRGGHSTKPHLARLVNYVGYLKAIDLSPLVHDPTDEVRDQLIRRLRDYVRPWSDLPRQYQLDLLYGYKSMGHYGAYLSASRGVLAVELPFYQRDVFRCSFSVSPRLRNYHRFMRAMIERLDPRVAAVPTTNGGPALRFTARRAPLFVPYVQDHGRRIAKQLTKNLPGPTVGAPPATVEDQLALARRELLDEWRETRFQELRVGRLFDSGRLSALAQSSDAVAGGWPILGRLITLELALEAVDASLE